jgi:glycosyltransferase involved in cell wall biosynthesis
LAVGPAPGSPAEGDDLRIAFMGDGSLGHVRRWGGYFHERGHDVLLLSFEDVEGIPFPSIRFPMRLPTKLAGYLSALPLVRKTLGDFRPDLLNALYVSGYGLLGSLSGVRPFIVSALGSDLLVDYPSSAIHRLQIRRALGRADLVTTDAEVLSEAASLAGAPRGRILKIFFGIDETIFHPGPGKDRPAGGKTASLTIVSTRNLYDIYNLDLLIDASPLISEGIDARFIVCGKGPLRERLEEKVSRLGMTERFTFAGRLDPTSIAALLRKADVYVSTSRSDSTSVSLLEAMACGAFPVVTDIPANREWIEDGVNGRLFPADSPEELARAVLAAADPGSIERCVKINAGLIMEKGLWKPNMERIESAFIRLVSEKGRGSTGKSA